MHRIINISFHESIAATIGNNPAFPQAFHYLSMWGNSDLVQLYVDRDMNIDASHQRVVSKDILPLTYKQYYFIAGIYDATKKAYSFHS